MNVTALQERLARLQTVESRAEEALRGVVKIYESAAGDENFSHATRMHIKRELDALVSLVLNGPPAPAAEPAADAEPVAPANPSPEPEPEPEKSARGRR